MESRFTALEGAVTARLDAMERRFSVQEERASAMLAVIVRMAERLDRTPEPIQVKRHRRQRVPLPCAPRASP